ncbi:hypothetical protein ACH5RR_025444 [Cinchona calisaya]|uniref:Uncharacterized protein n=1 Tax=Cinchona calisaya TaxID=153742 RepID=A0ABD2YZN7_9GENT
MLRRLVGLVVKFFLTLITISKQRLLSSVPPELPTTTGELELSPADVSPQEPPPIITTDQEQQQPPRQANVDYMMMRMHKCVLTVIGVCFTAVSAALQAYQSEKPLPIIFHWFCMTLELSFVAMLMSIYIRRRYEFASLVMEQVAIFLGFTAFMMAIGMNLPPPFMQIKFMKYMISTVIISTSVIFHLFVSEAYDWIYGTEEEGAVRRVLRWRRRGLRGGGKRGLGGGSGCQEVARKGQVGGSLVGEETAEGVEGDGS